MAYISLGWDELYDTSFELVKVRQLPYINCNDPYPSLSFAYSFFILWLTLCPPPPPLVYISFSLALDSLLSPPPTSPPLPSLPHTLPLWSPL